MQWLKKHWLLVAILLLALFFRLYRIEATMTFLEDEGRDLLIVKRMVDTGRPVLLGPQTSTGNMYLGPLYYYFITPALVLSGMNPIGPAILIALTGVITTYLLYYLGKKWFSSTAGYLAALMFAVLPMSVMVTRASWNPNLVPLITVLMLLVYSRLRNRQYAWENWLFYGMLVGIMVQLHYMALVFCGALSLVIAWQAKSQFKQLIIGVLFSFLGAIIVLSPFIVFEIRNDWVNTRAITRFMEAKEERNIRYDLPLWLWWNKVSGTSYRLIGNAFTGSSAAGQNVSTVVTISIALIALGFIVALKQKHRLYLSLLSVLILSMAVLGIYQENIHLHYIEFTLPLIFLSLAGLYSLLDAKSWRLFIFISILISLVYGGYRSVLYLGSGANHQAKKSRDVAEYIVNKAAGDPYNVVSTQGMYTTPFQYFLAISDHPPTNSLAKRVFDICEGSPCPQDDETTTLLFLTGPGHPSIGNYLGHPELNSFDGKRKMISNEHVSVGIWVAEIVLE